MTVKNIKSTENKIKKLEKQKAILAKKIRLEKNKLNAEKRKKRTKRLIEKGAVIEKLQAGNAEKITPEKTFEWLKQNIVSEKEKELAKQLKAVQDELRFFKRGAESWNIALNDGSRTTITKFLDQKWAEENKKISGK